MNAQLGWQPGTFGKGSSSVHKTTRLSVTGIIASGSTYSVIASGVNYNKSGDDGNLSTLLNFNGLEGIKIYLNGVLQLKTVDVVWASSLTFVLNKTVDDTDEILVIT